MKPRSTGSTFDFQASQYELREYRVVSDPVQMPRNGADRKRTGTGLVMSRLGDDRASRSGLGMGLQAPPVAIGSGNKAAHAPRWLARRTRCRLPGSLGLRAGPLSTTLSAFGPGILMTQPAERRPPSAVSRRYQPPRRRGIGTRHQPGECAGGNSRTARRETPFVPQWCAAQPRPSNDLPDRCRALGKVVVRSPSHIAASSVSSAPTVLRRPVHVFTIVLKRAKGRSPNCRYRWCKPGSRLPDRGVGWFQPAHARRSPRSLPVPEDTDRSVDCLGPSQTGCLDAFRSGGRYRGRQPSSTSSTRSRRGSGHHARAAEWASVGAASASWRAEYAGAK